MTMKILIGRDWRGGGSNGYLFCLIHIWQITDGKCFWKMEIIHFSSLFVSLRFVVLYLAPQYLDRRKNSGHALLQTLVKNSRLVFFLIKSTSEGLNMFQNTSLMEILLYGCHWQQLFYLLTPNEVAIYQRWQKKVESNNFKLKSTATMISINFSSEKEF